MYWQASEVDLTFANRLAAASSSECQILTRNLNLLVVLLILTFAKVPAAKGMLELDHWGPGCKDQRNPECKVFRDNDDAGPAKTS